MDITILEVVGFDGESYEDIDALAHLGTADQVFYSVNWGGEDHYRWIGGPFETVDDVIEAIEENEEFYVELAG